MGRRHPADRWQLKLIAGAMVLCAAVASLAAEGENHAASLDTGARAATNVIVKETTEYYKISGARMEDLRQEICDKGCRRSDGKTYDSLTNWHVKWDYDHDKGPLACKARDFRVNVDITFRYPEWVRPDNAPEALVEKWESYVKRLVAHEEGHRDRAVEAANDLIRTVGNLPGAPTCAELDRTVRALCRDRMNSMAEDQERYDASTGHGSSQGAMLQ